MKTHTDIPQCRDNFQEGWDSAIMQLLRNGFDSVLIMQLFQLSEEEMQSMEKTFLP